MWTHHRRNGRASGRVAIKRRYPEGSTSSNSGAEIESQPAVGARALLEWDRSALGLLRGCVLLRESVLLRERVLLRGFCASAFVAESLASLRKRARVGDEGRLRFVTGSRAVATTAPVFTLVAGDTPARSRVGASRREIGLPQGGHSPAATVQRDDQRCHVPRGGDRPLGQHERSAHRPCLGRPRHATIDHHRRGRLSRPALGRQPPGARLY